jgi:hypothetical protein
LKALLGAQPNADSNTAHDKDIGRYTSDAPADKSVAPASRPVASADLQSGKSQQADGAAHAEQPTATQCSASDLHPAGFAPTANAADALELAADVPGAGGSVLGMLGGSRTASLNLASIAAGADDQQHVDDALLSSLSGA